MAKSKRDASAQSDIEIDIAIIGAGIAGLYCGYRLDESRTGKRHDYLIAEASAHVGGRIWSTRIGTNGEALDDGGRVNIRGNNITYRYRTSTGKVQTRPVEFVAEYGPMRIELDLQHCLEHLIHDLTLEDDLQSFPPYESPTSPYDPKYHLTEDEEHQATPLELLHLGIVRIIGRLVCSSEKPAHRTAFARLHRQFARHMALIGIRPLRLGSVTSMNVNTISFAPAAQYTLQATPRLPRQFRCGTLASGICLERFLVIRPLSRSVIWVPSII